MSIFESEKFNKLLHLRKLATLNGEPILREKSYKLLLDLIIQNQPKKILEIGTNVGISGISMLLCSENATLSTIEIDEDKIKQARQNFIEFGVEERAKIFIGDAGQIIPLITGEYDFIFLDGPKGHYFEYLQNLLEILKVGGILFADNVLFRGYVNGKVKTPHRFNTTKHSMENFLTEIQNNKNLQTVVYDIEDGVSVTKRLN